MKGEIMSRKRTFIKILGLIFIILWVTACGAAQSADAPTPTATTVPPTATPAPTPTNTPVPTPVSYSEASGWFFDTNSSAVTRVKVVDLNKDGQPEVVVAATKMVYALDNEGSLLWEYELPSAIRDVVIADINEDNSPDIFVGGSLHDVMLDSEGNEIWFHDFSSYGAASFLRNYAADMNGDGKLEVGYLHPSAVAVFSGQSGGFIRDAVQTRSSGIWVGDVDGEGGADIVLSPERDTKVSVYKGTGGALWQQDLEKIVRLEQAGDVTGDGEINVVALTEDWELLLFDSAGSQLWRQSIASSDKKTDVAFPGQLACADITGDGQEEIVVLTPADEQSDTIRTLKILDGDGNEIWHLKLETSPRFSKFAVVDGNNDGNPEILIKDTQHKSAFILNNIGQLLATFSIPSQGDIAYADLNNDGFAEVIVGSQKGIQVLGK